MKYLYKVPITSGTLIYFRGYTNELFPYFSSFENLIENRCRLLDRSLLC